MATTHYLTNNILTTTDIWANQTFWSVLTSARQPTIGVNAFDYGIVNLSGGTDPWVLYGLPNSEQAGAGLTLVLSTVAGPTAGLPFADGLGVVLWATPPLAADVTIAGTITYSMYALENNMSANALLRAMLFKVDSNGEFTLISSSTDDAELATAKALHTWTATPTSTAMKIGDRLALAVLIDDSGTMASGFTATLYFDGSAANTANSNFSLTENLTFLTTAPSGTSYFLRNTASDVTVGSAVKKALSTTQGAGTSSAIRSSATGPIAFPGNQWTDSAGGTVIEWFTPQLNAFSLSGVVSVVYGFAAALESLTTAAFVPEIAICDSDGNLQDVWATGYMFYNVGGGANIFTKYMSGPSMAVDQGGRIRVRFYCADPFPVIQASGTNFELRYDGTTTYASKIQFSQTITEGGPAAPNILVKRRSALQAVGRSHYW
jgi:hypothetical protein